MGMFMIMYILDDPKYLSDVLRAWKEAGSSGVTIFDTTGTGTLNRRGYRDDLPLIPSLIDLLSQQDAEHKTLVTIVDDEATADRIFQVTQDIVEDFTKPNTGLLCVVPVLKAVGLNKSPRAE
jgi:nitrogen regulatory protein P-II 1